MQVSQWSGKLLQPLGVGGSVNPFDLENLLNGRAATGEVLIDKLRLHQQQLNARDASKAPPTERAGIDVTASAPKSVSIQALVFGDHRLEAAQQQANARMLEVLEERYAIVCLREGGKRRKMLTGELAIASFHHDTSRSLDPQLHTHNVLLNLQRRPDSGRWQSLDNAEIYQAKMLLGQIYRNELALQVQALGYRIHVTDQCHGLWDLEGFSDRQLKAFSTRSQQIEAAVGTNANSKTKEWAATRVTRSHKRDVPRSDLLKHWHEQADTAQMLQITPIHPLMTQTSKELAPTLVAQSLTVLAEQGIDFYREEIERLVLQQPGQVSFADLQQAINHHPTPLIGNNDHDFSRNERQDYRGKGGELTLPTDVAIIASRHGTASPSTEGNSTDSSDAPEISDRGSVTGVTLETDQWTADIETSSPERLGNNSTTSNQAGNYRQNLGRSHPQSKPISPNLWEGWTAPAPATAEQMEQLITLLQPLPKSLITLKQLLEITSRRTDLQMPLVNLQETLEDLKQSLPQQLPQKVEDSTGQHLNLITEQLKQTNQSVLELKAQLKTLPPSPMNSKSIQTDLSSTLDHNRNQRQPWLEIPIGKKKWNFAKPLEVVLIIFCTASLTASLIQYHPRGMNHINNRINDVFIKLGGRK